MTMKKSGLLNQKELGKPFGVSAMVVGKILLEAGLKDSGTKKANQKAEDEGYAVRLSSVGEIPHFRWNAEKTHALLAEHLRPLGKVDDWVKEVTSMLKQTKKLCDKELGFMVAEGVYNKVPEDLKEQVKAETEKLKKRLFPIKQTN